MEKNELLLINELIESKDEIEDEINSKTLTRLNQKCPSQYLNKIFHNLDSLKEKKKETKFSDVLQIFTDSSDLFNIVFENLELLKNSIKKLENHFIGQNRKVHFITKIMDKQLLENIFSQLKNLFHNFRKSKLTNFMMTTNRTLSTSVHKIKRNSLYGSHYKKKVKINKSNNINKKKFFSLSKEEQNKNDNIYSFLKNDKNDSKYFNLKNSKKNIKKDNDIIIKKKEEIKNEITELIYKKKIYFNLKEEKNEKINLKNEKEKNKKKNEKPINIKINNRFY